MKHEELLKEAAMEIFDSEAEYEATKQAFRSLRKSKQCPCTKDCGHAVESHILRTENHKGEVICRECYKQLAADYRRAIEVISHYADKENWAMNDSGDETAYTGHAWYGHDKAAEFLKNIGEGE